MRPGLLYLPAITQITRGTVQHLVDAVGGPRRLDCRIPSEEGVNVEGVAGTSPRHHMIA